MGLSICRKLPLSFADIKVMFKNRLSQHNREGFYLPSPKSAALSWGEIWFPSNQLGLRHICRSVSHSFLSFTHFFFFFLLRLSVCLLNVFVLGCSLESTVYQHVLSLGEIMWCTPRGVLLLTQSAFALIFSAFPLSCCFPINFKISSMPFQNYHSGKEVACSVKSIAA